jgi:hypothetical protein
MRKKVSVFLILGLLFNFSYSGCALFLIGAAGAAGGYAISKDEIEGLTDHPYDKAWAAVREVVRTEGAITAENKKLGTMEAIIGGSTVEIHMDQATSKTVRTRIKARKTKGLFPDIDLAQSIYAKMTRKLK